MAIFKVSGVFASLIVGAGPARPPEPYGALPTERQLRWHELETYAFIHFGINTFTDKEWGFGDEAESLFNPTDFSADQLAETCRAAGLKALILTCKHHDGFCLWPSRYTEHSVKRSPWREGRGDLVREVADACRRHGLRFGVYLSPWDRNHAAYGTPEYVTYYRQQLRELLTEYGEICEVWFDGANGGDGYYGGANERRTIDNSTYYDWPTTWALVRELQPLACMFSDSGPDCRWVGNESGWAGETCWATFDKSQAWPGHADRQLLNEGLRDGPDWVPAEIDVSLRPGWFYHAREDDEVKTVGHLLKIYFESVGRGGNLLLNLPPDRRGRIPDLDVARLTQWRRILDETFAVNLAAGATVTASDTRGDDPTFAPANVLDGDHSTYWSTADDRTAPELVLDLGEERTFNVVRLREYLPLGQRIGAFALDLWRDGAWVEFAAGTSIGSQRLVVGPYVTTSRVRLRITDGPVCPALSEVGLFALPELLAPPSIRRDRQGLVTLSTDTPGPVIRYTLDGTEPGPTATVYEQPFALPLGGTVKARVHGQLDGRPGEVAAVSFGVAPTTWRVLRAEGDARRLFDGHPRSLWQAPAAPQEVVLDLGRELTLSGFGLLPRQDGQTAGTPDRYALYVSTDPDRWAAPAAAGELSNIAANPVRQRVEFAAPATGRFVRFVVERALGEGGVVVAELELLAAPER